MNERPTTLAGIEAAKAYHEACERLANASVALHRAQVEHSAALVQHAGAHAAALSTGVISK